MKSQLSPHVERLRVRKGPFSSNSSFGLNGAFVLEGTTPDSQLQVISSDGGGWEHVSVVVRGESRTPTWEEMCLVKSFFWNDNETVVQYHPTKDSHINIHQFALHLWKKTGEDYSLPSKEMV